MLRISSSVSPNGLLAAGPFCPLHILMTLEVLHINGQCQEECDDMQSDSEAIAHASEDVDGRRRGEEALNRVSRAPGVGREGPKRLVCGVEQIVDLDETRELLPARPH